MALTDFQMCCSCTTFGDFNRTRTDVFLAAPEVGLKCGFEILQVQMTLHDFKAVFSANKWQQPESSCFWISFVFYGEGSSFIDTSPKGDLDFNHLATKDIFIFFGHVKFAFFARKSLSVPNYIF